MPFPTPTRPRQGNVAICLRILFVRTHSGPASIACRLWCDRVAIDVATLSGLHLRRPCDRVATLYVTPLRLVVYDIVGVGCLEGVETPLDLFCECVCVCCGDLVANPLRPRCDLAKIRVATPGSPVAAPVSFPMLLCGDPFVLNMVPILSWPRCDVGVTTLATLLRPLAS